MWTLVDNEVHELIVFQTDLALLTIHVSTQEHVLDYYCNISSP